MLKKYLITMQQPSCVRSRYVVRADSTFAALDKVMDRMTTGPQPLHVDSYLAARLATPDDVEKYAEWMI
jgi:hypothetical protein